MAKLLIASNNPGKLVEFEALLRPAAGLERVELILPRQIGLALDVLEDGQTYAENAARKAQAYYRAVSDLGGEKPIILADDSGLEVDCLGGAPGLHSARYSDLVVPQGAPQAGAIRKGRPPGNDADRRALLLRNLAGQPRPWLAHFHCTVALISSAGELVYTHADCPGEIIPIERGSGGFGYDPIFLLPALGLTMAELSMEQKNQLSHRALAVKAAIPVLQGWLNS
jgi:XTP/dITP diphosphohydrolase